MVFFQGVQHCHGPDVVHGAGPGDEHGQDRDHQLPRGKRGQWNQVLVSILS